MGNTLLVLFWLIAFFDSFKLLKNLCKYKTKIKFAVITYFIITASILTKIFINI